MYSSDNTVSTGNYETIKQEETNETNIDIGEKDLNNFSPSSGLILK